MNDKTTKPFIHSYYYPSYEIKNTLSVWWCYSNKEEEIPDELGELDNLINEKETSTDT